MSYRAGLFGRNDPTISCDGPDCAERVIIDGLPPAWFLANRPKPGWLLVRVDGATRKDYCPRHRKRVEDAF